MSSEIRAGHVALVGLPNAGKSSLLNAFLGSKLSIVTPFAQTTRERVVGIDTRDGAQMVFLDTPGIVDPAYLLHHSMAEIVEAAIEDADVVVLLLDGTKPPPGLAPEIADALRKLGSRLVTVVNKVDTAPESGIRALQEWSDRQLGVRPRRISVTTGEGVEALREEISSRLPVSPLLYPDDELSTQSLRFFVSELVRETVFEQFQEEIPYSVAVKVDEFRENRSPVLIRATVYVERQSQKAIIIGRGGAAIRELGAAARRKIEELVGEQVYLELWVKVLPKWRKDPLELRRLGFPLSKQKHHA